MAEIETTWSPREPPRRTHPAAGGASTTPVIHLNESAAVYEALARRIEGTAVGWSDSALAELERNLLSRYGPLLGGRAPVRRLVRLASRSLAS